MAVGEHHITINQGEWLNFSFTWKKGTPAVVVPTDGYSGVFELGKCGTDTIALPMAVSNGVFSIIKTDEELNALGIKPKTSYKYRVIFVAPTGEPSVKLAGTFRITC